MPSHLSGFTLLEVLVALVILAVGLLGAAALQINALSSAHSAYQRSIASVIAVDAGERLWVDLANGQLNANKVQTQWQKFWQDRLDTTLPDFSGSIACNDDNVCTITVIWSETRFQNEPQQTSFSYLTRLLPNRL